MLVTNKNQIEPHNEGFGALTYWCKLNTISAHLPTLSIAENLVFLFTASVDISLPTCYFAIFTEDHKIQDHV